jgi:hypothetical protein
MNNSELIGIGTAHIWESEYLIFKRNDKVYSKKCVHYCNSDCTTNEISFSQPMEIYLDSLFDFLNKYIKQIENEEVYPYIFQIKVPILEFMFTMYSHLILNRVMLWAFIFKMKTSLKS